MCAYMYEYVIYTYVYIYMHKHNLSAAGQLRRVALRC